MNEHTEISTPTKPSHKGGLLLVGFIKVVESVFFILLSVIALKLVHRNLGDMAERLVDVLHIDPMGKLASFVMDRADLIDHHQLRVASMLSAVWAVLRLVEGVGLMKQQLWAEYLTIVATSFGLPWEIYEMHHHFNWFKFGLFLVNIAVLTYLIVILRRDKAAGELY